MRWWKIFRIASQYGGIGLEQRDQVRRTDDRDGGGVEIRRERDTGERRVTAVGPAHDADALRVRNALGDQVLDAPRDVVLHLVAPLRCCRRSGTSCRSRWSRGSSAAAPRSRGWRGTAGSSCSPSRRAPTGRRAARRSAGGSSRERPSAASGMPGSRGRRTTCSGSLSSPRGARAASFSRTRY